MNAITKVKFLSNPSYLLEALQSSLIIALIVFRNLEDHLNRRG